MKLILTAALAAAVMAVGTTASTFAGTDPKLLVLRLTDMPAGYSKERGFRTHRGDKDRLAYIVLGLEEGYAVEFAKPGVDARTVFSTVERWNSLRSARQGAGFLKSTLERDIKVARQPLSTGGRVGDRSVAYVGRVRHKGELLYAAGIAWRRGRYAALLEAASRIEGFLDADQLVTLARRVDARMRRAK